MKNLKSLGKTLNKQELKKVSGGLILKRRCENDSDCGPFAEVGTCENGKCRGGDIPTNG